MSKLVVCLALMGGIAMADGAPSTANAASPTLRISSPAQARVGQAIETSAWLLLNVSSLGYTLYTDDFSFG